MSWKENVKAYLVFSKKDRIGLLVLVFLVLFIYALPWFFPEKPLQDPVFLEAAAILEDSASKRTQTPSSAFHSAKKQQTYNPSAPLFRFDPNELEANGWAALGLTEKNIKTILNYRSKGGRFNKPEDLQRIWGIPEGFYERVEPYITIKRENNSGGAFQKSQFPKPARSIISVDVNASDSSALEQLPGIGPKLAGRITVFRNKLGGFHSVDQVRETYGLPDSTFQKIRPLLNISGEVRKININAANKEELSAHPYIRWKLANAIIAYRQQHGNFSSIEDLKKILIVDEEAFKKMQPYLEL